MNGRILETPGDKIREMVKEAKEAGLSEGVTMGVSQGILNAIQMCKNMNVSEEDTIKQLVKVFSITEEEAREYIEKL